MSYRRLIFSYLQRKRRIFAESQIFLFDFYNIYTSHIPGNKQRGRLQSLHSFAWGHDIKKCLGNKMSFRNSIRKVGNISIQKYPCFQVYIIHDVLFKGANRPMDGGHPGPRHRPVGCEGRESGDVRPASGIVHYLGLGILIGAPDI